MRLLALAVIAVVGGAAVAVPGRIIVDENTRKDMIADGSTHLRPFASPPLVFREERVHGEVTVLSPPLYVRGPPKGFPFSRWRPKRQATTTTTTPTTSTSTATSTSTTRPTTPDRVHGEVIVQTSFISVGRPAKGQESRSRKTRDVSDESRGEGVKTERGRGSMTRLLKRYWPYFLIPTMMTIGYAPFILMALKMFIIKVMMFNMMAFNAAIFMTLRNLVFGPRSGGHVKYVNFGYQHRQSKRAGSKQNR